MRSVIIVFLGAGIGGALRHLAGLAALRLLGPDFPYGTMFVNVVGAATMGLLVGLFAFRVSGDADLRLFLTTGLLGGFTTWSTFALDTVTLWDRGNLVLTLLYTVGSFVLSIAALGTMLLLARRLA
ncbi:fluoride efflux transporter CrcB [Sphingomonas sp. H39-1-10]|uniref:fluoride efflux transporter CrcB n=1 Tax=Sphingomonas pollutisoli TaxID=3030829 RepID=UPI0023B99FE2|nr:fluoride efflux transporter CrcB [Sphingomonas pollutisoli]MDF0491356.1 fluoride efflux transporter CrcB [Sphingomonas pollutisoli]